jgi:hypothetical protein
LTVGSSLTGVETSIGIGLGIDIEVECMKLSLRRPFHAAISCDPSIEFESIYSWSISETYLKVNVHIFITMSKSFFKNV